MKISMFNTPASYIEWATAHIKGIRENGLRRNKEELSNALKGIGKESWLEMNYLSDKSKRAQDTAWADHIEWLKGAIASTERNIKKIEKEIAKAQALI